MFGAEFRPTEEISERSVLARAEQTRAFQRCRAVCVAIVSRRFSE